MLWIALAALAIAVLKWLGVKGEHVVSLSKKTWSTVRDATLRVLDRVSGSDRPIPSFGERLPDAEVFVHWVESRDSHVVYAAARKVEEDREGWPRMQSHCGFPFWAKFEMRNTTEGFCTLRFVDGSEAICHIRTNNGEAGLKPVQIRGADIDRADAVRREMEANAMVAAYAATVMESPGAHINVGTGDTRWIEPPSRVKSEGGRLTVKRSSLWDWKAAWNRNFRKKLRGE